MMKTLIFMTASLVAVSMTVASDRTAFDIQLDKDKETELALSAAPEHLRAGGGDSPLGSQGV